MMRLQIPAVAQRQRVGQQRYTAGQLARTESLKLRIIVNEREERHVPTRRGVSKRGVWFSVRRHIRRRPTKRETVPRAVAGQGELGRTRRAPLFRRS
jgi:hypothetical protein